MNKDKNSTLWKSQKLKTQKEQYPMMIEHCYLNESMKVLSYYGITKIIEKEDDLREYLTTNGIYFCAKNLVYIWNQKERKYVEYMKFKNTDNGRCIIYI